MDGIKLVNVGKHYTVKREQVKVLYYNSKDDFAIKLETKQEDEVILCKNPQGNTFNEIYQNIIKQGGPFLGDAEISMGKFRFTAKKKFQILPGQGFQFGPVFF